MSNSKFLSESGWKDMASKNGVKDNGLLKKLADFRGLHVGYFNNFSLLPCKLAGIMFRVASRSEIAAEPHGDGPRRNFSEARRDDNS